jgi:hypothetical protein
MKNRLGSREASGRTARNWAVKPLWENFDFRALNVCLCLATPYSAVTAARGDASEKPACFERP